MTWAVAIVVGGGGAFAAWFVLPWLLRRRAVHHLHRLCAARRAIVLTYDDGPGTRLSPALADLLARHGVRATFFVIGARAAGQPQVVQALQAAGQENPQPDLHIRGDRDVRYERVAQAMAAAQQAGLKKIGFITEPVHP